MLLEYLISRVLSISRSIDIIFAIATITPINHNHITISLEFEKKTKHEEDYAGILIFLQFINKCLSGYNVFIEVYSLIQVYIYMLTVTLRIQKRHFLRSNSDGFKIIIASPNIKMIRTSF